MIKNDRNPELRDDVELGPAIALLELCSIARGIEVADAILWEARIELLVATAVQPGKYVMLFTGGVEDLDSALARGEAMAREDLVDQLLIQNVHPQVEIALRREGHLNGRIDALGVVETKTVASAVLAADAALKRATVDLLELRIANGLGGKSYLSLTGEVSDVRSSVQAAAAVAEERGQLARQVVIPRPHTELVRYL
jgi:microcompartment protein CcmL/EutN